MPECICWTNKKVVSNTITINANENGIVEKDGTIRVYSRITGELLREYESG